jgi:RNA polymerase sigma factor (sigma-70 family)
LRVARDIDVAEECVQDAYTRALATWRTDGIPANPGAWLTTVSRRRAIDLARRRDLGNRVQHLLVTDEVVDTPGVPEISDDRLRLIFTCCHPSLNLDAQVALALHLLCGLSTAEVAKAFLVKEATMAARLTRAKKKIALARIPYRVPEPDEMRARIDAVLTVIHLLFTTGHTAPVGESLTRDDLIERSLDLSRMLHSLLPHDPEVTGLLALIVITDSRRHARVGRDGALVTLEFQDRTLWVHESIDEGLSLVSEAVRRGRPGRFTLMAALSAVHASSPRWDETDWREIVGLYDLLMESWPSPVVALNRAVAVGFADGPVAGLAALSRLETEPQLVNYPYFAVARAECFLRLGDAERAHESFALALLLTENSRERDHVNARMTSLRRETSTDPSKL